MSPATPFLIAVLCFVTVAGNPGFIRTVFVEYEDGTSQGHFQFGRSIGEAMGAVIREAWQSDKELQSMESWVQTSPGKDVFEALVSASNSSFPLYTREVEGMAEGAKVSLRRLLVNQLREELAQWVDVEEGIRRKGHCTDAYAVDPAAGMTALGHNDDWGVYWRNATYFVLATALDASGAAKFKFGSWVYPGYLAGEQLNWNSHGLLWTMNSLFPKQFRSTGVGTAWVARHMAGASNLADLIQRAADERVSTAMNYNLGDLHSKQLWNLEVDTGGLKGLRHITGAYVHANQFKVLNPEQFPEPSSEHREARWQQLQPNNISSLRAFLSDREDRHWPVWRNRTAGDDCYTEVTGIFDLEHRTLSVWTGLADSRAPEMELSLDFPGMSSLRNVQTDSKHTQSTILYT